MKFTSRDGFIRVVRVTSIDILVKEYVGMDESAKADFEIRILDGEEYYVPILEEEAELEGEWGEKISVITDINSRYFIEEANSIVNSRGIWIDTNVLC